MTKTTTPPTAQPEPVDYDAQIARADEEIAETEGTIARLRELLGRRRTEREQATGGARRDALHQLRAEIEPQIGADGPELVELAQNAHAAVAALAVALQKHNARLTGWIGAVREHGVPAHTSPAPEPSREHGHLGWLHSGVLAVGRSRVRPVDAEAVLRKVGDSARRSALGGAEPASFDELAALHDQAPELDPTHRYFLTADGGVNVYSPEGVNQHIAAGLRAADLGREIGEEEAVRTWWATERA